MHGLPGVVPYIGKIVNLGMAVMTWRDAILSAGCQNLVGLEFAIGSPFLWIARLEETAPSAAAIVVGAVGKHLHEVFFTHHRFDHIPQVFSHWVAKGLAHQLAGILYGEFDLAVFIPIGIHFELTLTDPLGIVLNNAPNLEIVVKFEFFQSGPDCKEFVPSLRIEPDLALEVLNCFFLDLHDMFPILIISHEHAVVLSCPAFGAVSPICSYKM